MEGKERGEQDLKAYSPNCGPYISLLANLENLVLHQDNIS